MIVEELLEGNQEGEADKFLFLDCYWMCVDLFH